jgi:hypothetical protein
MISLPVFSVLFTYHIVLLSQPPGEPSSKVASYKKKLQKHPTHDPLLARYSPVAHVGAVSERFEEQLSKVRSIINFSLPLSEYRLVPCGPEEQRAWV